MKKIKLEIHNHLGEVFKEDTLTISDGDKVIIQVPKGTDLVHQMKLHEAFKNTLTDDDKNVISIPDDVIIKILKVN